MLHDCGEMELVTGSREASQSHTLEAMMRLEVREPHLNPLAFVARFAELQCTHECASEIASILVDVSCDLAREHSRATLRFEWTCVAIALGRKITQHVVVTDVAGGLEHLAGGAGIDVALRVKREVAAWEGALPPGAFVPHPGFRPHCRPHPPTPEPSPSPP